MPSLFFEIQTRDLCPAHGHGASPRPELHAQSATSFGAAPTGPGAYVAKFSSTGDPLWSKALTSAAGAWDKVNSLRIMANEDVLVGGSFASTLDIGDGPVGGSSGGNSRAFIGRLRGVDGSGKGSDGGWARALCSGTSACYAPGVGLDGNGAIYLAGQFNGTLNLASAVNLTSIGTADVFLAKLAPDSALVWHQQIGASGAAVSLDSGGLAVSAGGDAVVSGRFTATVDFGGGPVAAPLNGAGFLVRYNQNKEYDWYKVLPTGNVRSLAADTDGNVFLTGEYAGSFDIGGGPLPSAGSNDVFVAKLSGVGAFVWNRSYGDAGEQTVARMILTPQNDPVIVGGSEGAVDFGAGMLAPKGALDGYIAQLSP